MIQFSDRLCDAILRKQSRVVVGLDPHIELLPPHLVQTAGAGRAVLSDVLVKFCVGIMDAVSDVVVGVKPQVAFFERLGPKGFAALEAVVRAAKDRELLVISDAKRGDIGSTASAYADYHLGSASADIAGLDADAMTVNPYLGEDSLIPFAQYVAKGRGIFLLTKTSNKGSADLQDKAVYMGGNPQPLYRSVAQLAQKLADSYPLGENGYSSVGLVVGATFPHEATELRAGFPSLPFLVPGVGAQGATARDIRGCFDSAGLGAIVNASRSVIFAYREDAKPQQWQEAARKAAISLKDDLNSELSLS